MKILKWSAFFVLITFVAACGKDDDATALPPTPTTQLSTGAVNWGSFVATSKNLTPLVTFAGQPSNTYTVNAIPGDRVTFTFNAGNKPVDKKVLELKMIGIDTPRSGGTSDDAALLQNIEWIYDPNDDNYILGFEVLSSAPEELDAKFDILVEVFQNGTSLGTDFLIDPKLKLRPSR